MSETPTAGAVDAARSWWSEPVFTPWHVLRLMALPTMFWAPWPELRGLAVLVLLVAATFNVRAVVVGLRRLARNA
jgi:hypothetical protein